MDRIGVYDDFFGLGGHSLLAAQLMAQVNERFRVDIPLRAIFEAPNVAGLADTIAAARAGILRDAAPRESSTPSLVQLRSGSGRESVFCIHQIGGTIHVYRPFADGLSPHLRVYGIQSRALVNPDLEYATLSEMVDAYAQLITAQRAESIHLVGYSSGGWIAIAIAGLLEQQGAPIQTVSLIDTHQFTLDVDKIRDGSLETLLLTARDSFPEEFSLLGEGVDSILMQSRGIFDQMHPLSDEEQIEFLFRSLGRFQFPHREEVQRALQTRLRLYHHHYKLVKGYTPPRIHSPLYVCLADTLLPGEQLERGFDWSKYTTGDLKIENVSGNHFSIMKPPTVAEVAARVSAWLKTATEKRVPAPMHR
jgi:thioesterase domain-containing protein